MSADPQNDLSANEDDGDEPESSNEAAPFVMPRFYHIQLLALAVLVIAASRLLSVREDQRIAMGGGGSQFVLPPVCVSRVLFHADCPGCGLTRSFVHLAHGNWEASWKVHRVGWLLAAMTLLQIPLRLWALYRWPQPLFSPLWTSRILWGLIVLLFLNWTLKLTVG